MPLFRALFTALALLLFSTALAADANDDKVTLNFVNADIDAVVKAVGQITGRNFLLDPRVKGTVNIVSASPIPRELTYQILLSALRLQGFAAIEGAGVTKIVPEADAKQNYTSTVEHGNSAVSGERIVTQVYPLQYESANQLVAVLRPLITPNNTIVAYPNTNTLVITDYADNIKRLNKIIESIDQPSQGELSVIPLKYASALDLSQALLKLMPEASVQQAAPGITPRFYIAADTRTNSLLVRAENPSYVQRVRNLVASLDTAAAAPSSIHVVYLRNADATKIAETLRGLLAGEAKSSSASLTNAIATTTAGTAPGANPGASSNPANNPFTSAPTTATASTIQADVATNSLIIAAPDNVYNSLRGVIDQLDTRRAQVFIEALIAEVTTDKNAEFGVQWQTLSGLNSTGTQGVGGTNFSTSSAATGNNILGAAQNLTSVGQGLSVGVIHGTVSIPGVGTVANLGLLIRALESDADTNILSTPNLLTMDNEEAKIVVGQNVPFITGSYANAATATTSGTTVTPFQTVDRQDVGITLRIKPTIAEGGNVRLKIYQEVSSIADSTNAAGIITNKRSVESTVLIQDGEIIVLGGLIQDSLSINSGKVPVLGNIPLLGNLFRYDQREKTKTNLMVFLRPYVIKNDNGIVSNSLTQERYDYIRGEQGSVRAEKRNVLPTMEAPQLPPWNPAPKRTVIVPAPADPSTISPETKGPPPKKSNDVLVKPDPDHPYDVKQ